LIVRFSSVWCGFNVSNVKHYLQRPEPATNGLVNLAGAPSTNNEEDGFHLELGTNQEEVFGSLKPVNNSITRPQIEEVSATSLIRSTVF